MLDAHVQHRIEDLARSRQELVKELHVRPAGLAWCERHTALIDRTLYWVFRELESKFPDLPPLSLVATGGYGRKELSPHSDVDLTVVPLDEFAAQTDDAVRWLFRAIHAAVGTTLGLQIGYQYRLIADAAGLDPQTRTSLLDARLVAGSQTPFERLNEAYWETFPTGEFLIAKIEERELAFARHNDTPLAVEPHLKEGAGGMRCYHCANWLGMAMGLRRSLPGPEEEHVLAMRNVLHAIAGRQVDLFSRARQAEIADVLERDVFALGSELAEAMVTVHARYLRAKELLHEARYQISNDVTVLRGEVRIDSNAGLSEAASGIAVATRLGLRVTGIRAATRQEVDGPSAMWAISCGEGTLRNLDKCGVLEGLLPELTDTRSLMPSDTVHAFSVFEHTMRVVRHLDAVPPGFLSDIRDSLRELPILYLAALLHDVGKAISDRPHSETGSDMAYRVAQRWRLEARVADTVAWLVREHLTLARFIRMRDVQHPQTAVEFSQIVGTRDRLAMLALLTWADVNGVGPGNWSPSQEAFLRELFDRTAQVLESKDAPSADPALYRRRIMRQFNREGTSDQELHAFVEGLPAYYLLSTSPELVREHYAAARRAIGGEPTIELYHQSALSSTEVTVCCLDEPGLLSRLLGVFYAFDLSLDGLRVCTARMEPPVAVDVFTVNFGRRPVPPATANQMSQALKDVITGATTVDDLLTARGKDPSRKQEILQCIVMEGVPTILEFRAPRGRGMAYRLSRTISEHGWNIVAARLGQWAGQGAAAFYVTGPGETALPREAVYHALGH